MKEEIELPVRQSGHEQSILAIIQQMKQAYAVQNKKAYHQNRTKGKHSGSVGVTGNEWKTCFLSEIDLPATLRNLPKGSCRSIQLRDVRLKRYRRKRKNAILLVVDASRSQGAKERLAFAKGTVMALLEQAYCDRDRVGMIVFGGSQAVEALHYTRSVDFAAMQMEKLKAGGNTPLAMGMRLAIQTALQDRRKYPDDCHLIILLTDGKANFDTEPGKPFRLALQAAETIKKEKIPLLLVDTENSIFGMGIAKQIADTAGGIYTEII